jgi:cation:H+ antiporter
MRGTEMNPPGNPHNGHSLPPLRHLEATPAPAYVFQTAAPRWRPLNASRDDLLRRLPLSTTVSAAASSAWSAVWTFPSILASAFLVAWAAEAAQFLVAQGLALALLAWLQTAPEFAVEAVIAWGAGKNPAETHLAIANFTGAIRLLIGLGWPMIYFVAAFSAARSGRRRTWADVRLESEHSVEVVGLVPPLVYFLWIWYKGRIDVSDSVVLILLYIAYLGVLWRMPPKKEDQVDDVARVSRAVLRLPGAWRGFAVLLLFAAGGFLLYVTVHPFLNSMLALAATLGVSNFVFIQWVAPFLSEFPEKLSAFYWARKVSGAPMALMNMVSSNINQWTVLAAMIPIVYSVSRGQLAALPFDPEQRLEILITVLQSLLAVMILANMRFSFWEAAILFILWFVQFIRPELRSAVAWIYGAWALFLFVFAFGHRGGFRAFTSFVRVFRRYVLRRASPTGRPPEPDPEMSEK